jgi:ABC transporter DrrB family efflux protein
VSAIPVPQSGPGRLTIAFADSLDVAGRNLRNMVRTPQVLVFSLVQPVLFVMVLRYAVGGAIKVPGLRYVDYLMPGIFAQAVAFSAMGTAVGLTTDLRAGLLERFRTLPMSRSAILVGRTVADLARSLLVIAVMVGVGFAVGFRVHTSAAGLFAALGLVALFAYVLSWGFVALGLAMREPEAAQAASVPLMFLLVFGSAAFVPLRTMPGWLQAFGAHQPLTALINAERGLVLGGPAAADVLAMLAWSGGLLIAFATLGVYAYQRLGH